jgi:hypothetical protein
MGYGVNTHMENVRNILIDLQNDDLTLDQTEEKIYDLFGYYPPAFHVGDLVSVHNVDIKPIKETVVVDVEYQKKREEWVYYINTKELGEVYVFEEDLTKL